MQLIIINSIKNKYLQMKNRDKILLGAAVGAGIAAFLFGTKPGKKLRKKLQEQGEDWINQVSERVQEETQGLSFDDTADKVMDFAVKNRDTISKVISSIFGGKNE